MNGREPMENGEVVQNLSEFEPYEPSKIKVDKNDTTKVNQKDNTMRDIYEMILYFVAVVVCVMLFYTYVAQQVQVDGDSMNYTLEDNDRLILEKISYRFEAPERFDIIVFRPYQDRKNVYYIKRIIGLPGETVQITDGDIYIDGKIIKENYGLEEIIDSGMASEPIKLSSDEYFVLGDNRNNSKDSRDAAVGVVKRSAITGRAFVRIWPVNELEVLRHQ